MKITKYSLALLNDYGDLKNSAIVLLKLQLQFDEWLKNLPLPPSFRSALPLKTAHKKAGRNFSRPASCCRPRPVKAAAL